MEFSTSVQNGWDHFPCVHTTNAYVHEVPRLERDIDTIGTRSIFPLEDGFVDAALGARSVLLDSGAILIATQVYGTCHRRVVDLSLIPLHVGSHTQECV